MDKGRGGVLVPPISLASASSRDRLHIRPGESLEPTELIRWCEERLAYFMVPRYVELREALPKTATERVEKYKLKQEGIGTSWDREAAGYRLRRDHEERIG